MLLHYCPTSVWQKKGHLEMLPTIAWLIDTDFHILELTTNVSNRMTKGVPVELVPIFSNQTISN